jgi:hypothetical protein
MEWRRDDRQDEKDKRKGRCTTNDISEQNNAHGTNDTGGTADRGADRRSSFFWCSFSRRGFTSGDPISNRTSLRGSKAFSRFSRREQGGETAGDHAHGTSGAQVILHTVGKADLAVSRSTSGEWSHPDGLLLPQISGTIEEVHFKEGSMVKEGQLS